MAIQLSQDFPVTYGGTAIKGVQSISFQTSNTLEPVYSLGSKTKQSESPTSFLTCSAEISYLIPKPDTGVVADAFYDEIETLTTGALTSKVFAVGSFEIAEAWLTSWQISGSPEGNIEATASLVFFENFGAPDVPGTEAPATLTFAQGMFSEETTGATAIMDNLFSFTYSRSVDMTPLLFIGQSIPTNMIKRASSGQVSLEGAEIGAALDLCGGDDANFTFAAKNCNGDLIKTYSLTGGKITGRNFNAAPNDIIRGSATITKNF